MIACSGRKVIFYDQVQRKDLNMVLNPKIQIQNITSISESKSMSKISSSTSKSQTSYSTLRPQHSGRHRSVLSLSTSSRSWIKPKRLPFHARHQVTQRRQSENFLKIEHLIIFGCIPNVLIVGSVGRHKYSIELSATCSPLTITLRSWLPL